MSEAFVHEDSGDRVTVLFDHAFTARNGVPPCTHARFHFIDHTRGFFALEQKPR